VRIILGWTSVLLVTWNARDMLEAGSHVSVHLSRHQAAVGIALGLTFLAVAWRPDRAYGLVPFAAVFTATLAATAAIDVVNGVSTMARESRHLVELAGLALLWGLGAVAGPSGRGFGRLRE
jgi:predicted anti-sigma-YlaC factor YlaD